MNRQGGFTLLEMLVAMALTAMLVLGIGQALAVVGKSWRAVSVPIGDDPVVITAFLRRQIAGAVPLSPETSGFVGGLDGMEFLGRAPSAALPEGLYRQRLELRDGELWYVWSPAEADRSDERRLIRDVRQMDIGYAGPSSGWQNIWSDPQALPRRVRLRFTVGERLWPELVVAPMVDWPILEKQGALEK